MNIARNIVTAVLMTVVTTLMVGIIYPLVITGSPRWHFLTRPMVN